MMKLTLKRDLPLMLAVLLAIWCMWYARPVGVDTLFPGLEPDSIYVTLIDFTGSSHVDRNLELTRILKSLVVKVRPMVSMMMPRMTV